MAIALLSITLYRAIEKPEEVFEREKLNVSAAFSWTKSGPSFA